MRPAATRPDAARGPSTLYVAFELGKTEGRDDDPNWPGAPRAHAAA